MSEVLDFEQKVQGLADYYRALEALDPRNPQHIEVANPAIFYGSHDFHASQALAKVCSRVLYDIGCHGRVEYGRRGLDKNDLREDTDGQRAERADVLAVMTSPIEAAERAQRAERIAGVLACIASGETLSMTRYNRSHHEYEDPQDFAIDSSRAIFGVFTNGHVSDRTLTIQYDTPVTFAPTDDVKVGEHLMRIDVPALFHKGNNLLIEPVVYN